MPDREVLDGWRLEGAGTADRVEAMAAEVLGGLVTNAVGTIHVCAVWRGGPQGRTVLRIGPNTPRSDGDAFLLNLSRAMAGAIVITGKLLRDEPQLHYALQGRGRLPEGLLAWRRSRIGEAKPPTLAVLTSGRDVDPSHPVWRSPVRPLIFTDADGEKRLSGFDVPKVVLPSPSLRATVEYLRQEAGVPRVTVEAGPSSSVGLYRPPLAVDSVLLSCFGGSALPEEVRGGRLFEGGLLEREFRRVAHREWTEPSGPWSFSLFRRFDAGQGGATP